MKNTDVQNLLSEEFLFFRGIWDHQKAITNSDKERYRLETVAERRHRLSNELFIEFDGEVQLGKFSGLKLGSNPSWGVADQASKLLGFYEPEVLNEIFSESNLNKRHFIDLGAADGYYGIGGLLKKRFDTAVFFEMDPSGQDCIRLNAQINNVTQFVKVRGQATESFFEEIDFYGDWNNVFILCDVEGAEFQIFTETTLKAIKGTTILIEIHNWIEDFWAKYEALLRMASADYQIETLSRTIMQLPDLKYLHSWTDDNRALLLSEGRPNVMRFLKLTTK
jgi:hypothetical protein